MALTQISVFMENKSGRLAEVAGTLGRAGVNIRALSLADTLDFGILRLIVDNEEKALEALEEQAFTVKLTEVVPVEVEDRPGGLAAVVQVLAKGGINVEYMYAFVEKTAGKAILVFKFADAEKAMKVLETSRIRVLSADEVKRL